MAWAVKVLRYRQVTFLVKNVEEVFPETFSQSASCLPDVDCPRTFTTRNAINDGIEVNMRTGTADGSLAGEGAWLVCWLGRRKVAMD